MLYVTGDTHGDFTRFSTRAFPQQREMTRADLVLILGDFGGVWQGTRKEAYWLDWLNDRPFTTLFIDGNHENYDLLSGYPTETRLGGPVRLIRPNVCHLYRGYVFQLSGKRDFVLGGAQSHDTPGGILTPGPDLARQRRALNRRQIRYRVQSEDWWPQELPSEAEYRQARTALEREHWMVDIIATHCLPTSLQRTAAPTYPENPLTDFLDEVHDKLIYRQWYAGHYHVERDFPNERLSLLNQRILPVP